MLTREHAKSNESLNDYISPDLSPHLTEEPNIMKYAEILCTLKNHTYIPLYDVITHNKNVKYIITTLRKPTHYRECYYNGITMCLPIMLDK
jgi:hypothetical protein